jgi:hypothetical protein
LFSPVCGGRKYIIVAIIITDIGGTLNEGLYFGIAAKYKIMFYINKQETAGKKLIPKW